MDNKQKRKLYKRTYKFVALLMLISIAFSIYVSGIALYENQSELVWLDVSLIIFYVVLAFLLLYDGFLTKKLKNKYLLANFVYFFSFCGLISVAIIWALEYFNIINISQVIIVSLVFLILNSLMLFIKFNFGVVISKLYQNTTITIDSVAETPNFDDELLLKKKLDELNRKLEIKKVQEQIDKVEKELDNK